MNRSQAVARRVREQIACLRGLPYDWNGEDGLPLREDARVFAEYKLFNGLEAGLDLSAADPEKVACTLVPDGTLEVAFEGALSDVLLHIPCVGIVNFFIEFKGEGDGVGFVEGRVRYFDDMPNPAAFRDVNVALATLRNPKP